MCVMVVCTCTCVRACTCMCTAHKCVGVCAFTHACAHAFGSCPHHVCLCIYHGCICVCLCVHSPHCIFPPLPHCILVERVYTSLFVFPVVQKIDLSPRYLRWLYSLDDFGGGEETPSHTCLSCILCVCICGSSG